MAPSIISAASFIASFWIWASVFNCDCVLCTSFEYYSTSNFLSFCSSAFLLIVIRNIAISFKVKVFSDVCLPFISSFSMLKKCSSLNKILLVFNLFHLFWVTDFFLKVLSCNVFLHLCCMDSPYLYRFSF